MTPSPRDRAKAAARKAAAPMLDRLHAEAAGSLRPELEAALDHVARLEAELDTVKAELRGEIELLWAELDARRSAAAPTGPSADPAS